MKRYLLIVTSFLLTLAQGAWAEETNWTNADTKDALNAAIADGAHIRLTANITLSECLKIGQNGAQTVTIDLNGRTLQRNLAGVDANGHVIEVFSQGTLTIVDKASGGTISGGRANNGGGICNYGTLNFEGGTITDCLADQQGGGIKNNSGATVIMSGGTILGNWGGDCGGIFNAEGGMLTMSGGTITGNTSNAGGGGVVNYGTANITGGTIHNNHATTRGGGIWNNSTLSIGEATITGNLADIDGGGIWNSGTLSIFYGTSITENTCKSDGGGIWSSGTLNMQDDITVQGNATSSGLASNVYLKSGHVINVTASLGGSRIGLTVEGNNGVATSGYASHNSGTSHFTNDRSAIAELGLVSGEAKVTPKSGFYYVDRAWDSANKKVTETLQFRPNGTNTMVVNGSRVTLNDGIWYVVDGTVSISQYILVDNGAHARLILCDGAKLRSSIRLGNGSSLSIYGQIDGTGAIEAYELEYCGIGSWTTTNETTLNIYGGTVTAEGGTYCAGIGSRQGNHGIHVNIYGGTVKAKGGANGAGIGSGDYDGHSDLNGGTITIYGGYVEGHGGDAAAGIGGGQGCSGGTITILGGTVYAYGGDDGAGIGSGQEMYKGGVQGGTITISGGTVYAYGTDVAAGIGAGEDADMGNITISGGIVEAHGGGGEEWAHAVASNDDNEGVNSVTLGNNMMVSSERFFAAEERYAAIRDRKDAIIKPCTHSGATYTAVNITDHRLGCSYCLTNSSPHDFGYFSECKVCHLVSLADNASNTDVIGHWDGQTKAVALNGRTLAKDGKWNTLCLPFSLNSLAGTPLEGATVKTLASATYADGTLTLTFSDALTAIEAGKPYIVKWEGQTSGDVVNPVFKGVTISDSYSPVETDGASFVGIYAPYHIDGANEKLLYLDTDNKLNQPTAAMTINAQRAYFQLASASDDSGDVNGDGEVNVADVTMLVDYILGKETVGFIIDNADVNGDGEINVTDVAALVNIILDSNNFVLENVVVNGADGISFGD